MKVAIYARVSTRDKEQNPETQLVALRKFIETNSEWEVFKEYVDKARAKDYQHRTAWEELCKDARQHRFKMVLVFRLDRAFRSVRECLNTIEAWFNDGITFRSYSEGAIDTSSPFGKFLLQVLAGVAELESGIIGERVAAGMARAKAEGKKMGKHRLNISPATLCEKLVDTGNVRQAARELNCSVPYIYKILQPLGINPPRVAKGSQRVGRDFTLSE